MDIHNYKRQFERQVELLKEDNGIIDENKEDSLKFKDYLLLDEDRTPLAIVEAKKTSVSVEKGEIQARTYRENIEKQTKIKTPIFLTKGTSWYCVPYMDRINKINIHSCGFFLFLNCLSHYYRLFRIYLNVGLIQVNFRFFLVHNGNVKELLGEIRKLQLVSYIHTNKIWDYFFTISEITGLWSEISLLKHSTSRISNFSL